jgi:hypothetical protein
MLETAWCVRESCFLSKKIFKTEERPFPPKTMSPPPLRCIPANGSLPMPTRCCLARTCSPGSLLHILIEIRGSSRMACWCTPPFHLWEHRCTVLQIVALASYLPLLNLLDCATRGELQAKGKAIAHPKIGSQKQTLAADKVRRWCGNLPCAGCA